MNGPTMRDLLVAMSLASGIESLELKGRNLRHARAIANALREELDRVESGLRACEQELERRLDLEAKRGQK